MKRSSTCTGADKGVDALPNLTFPEKNGIREKPLPVSLEEIIRLSEQMLPFENKRRQRSPAASYTPFVL